MKTLKLKLTLNVEFDPAGTPEEILIRQVNQVVRNAMDNGTLTGETSATVERYEYSVKKDEN